MEAVKKSLIELIDKLFLSGKIDVVSSEYKNLLGLRQDLTTGSNTHTYRPEKGEQVREVTGTDLPLYALRVLSNSFLQGVSIAEYSSDFKGVVDGLKSLNLKQDREIYSDNPNETMAQNHDRIMSAFRGCSKIISDRSINATFTGSLALYTKAGVESGRNHSDVDFYIEEGHIFQFLKGLKESGQKFEFKDERLSQKEGSFDKDTGRISVLNGGTGGGHQCQVNLINPLAPKGFTEIGFFLSRHVQTESVDQTRFVKYYIDRSNGCERPIAVSQQMPNNITTNIDVAVEGGDVSHVNAHSFEYNLKFKMGTPKARTKDVEDALMFTQNTSLQQFNAMQNESNQIDKNFYLVEGREGFYPAVNEAGNVVDERTPQEKIVDEVFATAESIIDLKGKLDTTVDEEERATISEQILAMQNAMQFSYSQISTQDLIAGLNDKMQLFEDRFAKAMPLDGLQREEPLTDENLEEYEFDFKQKQMAKEEVFETLHLNQTQAQDDAMVSTFDDE